LGQYFQGPRSSSLSHSETDDQIGWLIQSGVGCQKVYRARAVGLLVILRNIPAPAPTTRWFPFCVLRHHAVNVGFPFSPWKRHAAVDVSIFLTLKSLLFDVTRLTMIPNSSTRVEVGCIHLPLLRDHDRDHTCSVSS
jgi:hypothetical protein